MTFSCVKIKADFDKKLPLPGINQCCGFAIIENVSIFLYFHGAQIGIVGDVEFSPGHSGLHNNEA